MSYKSNFPQFKKYYGALTTFTGIISTREEVEIYSYNRIQFDIFTNLSHEINVTSSKYNFFEFILIYYGFLRFIATSVIYLTVCNVVVRRMGQTGYLL